jgi:hypothetical protein
MKKIFLALMLVLALAISSVPVPAKTAYAATVTNPTVAPPAPVPDSGTMMFNNDAYRASAITYKDKASYYLITYNKNGTSYTNGQTVYVTFDGVAGSVSTAGTADGVTVFQATVILLSDTNADGRAEFTNQFSKANSTVFVDGGTYYGPAYNNLSNTNLAIVGLTNKDGANPVVFNPTTIAYGWGGSAAAGPANIQGNATERYTLSSSGLMWQNFVIDADGASVLYGNNGTKPSALSPYWNNYNAALDDDANPATGVLGWGTPATTGNGSTDRGEYLIYLQSTSNALLRNITARNVGTVQVLKGSMSTYVTNGGLAVDPRATLQNNLENVTFENITGNNFGITSFRIVMLKEVPNLNIKDLTITQSSTLGSSQPLWEEIGNASYDIGSAVQGSDIRFAGTLTISGYDDPTLLAKDSFPTGSKPLTYDRITLASNAFANFTVPDGYQFAVFNVGTATGTSSSNSSSGYSGQIYLYKSLSDFKQAWVTSNTNYQQVVYDLRDNAWLVRQPAVGATNDATVNDQLAGINTVLRRLAQAKGADTTTGSTSNGRALITDASIKIVADTTGVLPGFTVPSTPLTSEAPRVHIKAVNNADVLYTDSTNSSGAAADTLVPFKAGDTITLAAPNNAEVRLYNIDFHAQAHYTLEEAISGISSTSLAPRVSGSTVDTFGSDRFTTLVQALTLSVPSSLDANTADNDDGKTYTVLTNRAPFTPTVAVSQAFTLAASGYQQVTPSTSFVPDDPSLGWESSDTSVATVDPNTGLVTIIGAGTVTITAHALDTYNDGEILKPLVSFTLLTKSPIGTVVAHYVDAAGNEIAPSVITTGPAGLVYTTTEKTIEGYTLTRIEGNAMGTYIDGTIDVFYVYTQKVVPPPSIEPTPSVTPTLPPALYLPTTGDTTNGGGLLATMITALMALGATLVLGVRRRRGEVR